MENLKLIVDFATLVVIIGGLIYADRELREAKKAKFFSLKLQSEKDFDDLNRLMIEHKELRDTYRLNDTFLGQAEDNILKTYVYFELYYAHLSRTHMFMTSDDNPLRHSKKSLQYWELYENILKYWLNHPVFVEVHKNAKNMKTFDPLFIDKVDSLLQH